MTFATLENIPMTFCSGTDSSKTYDRESGGRAGATSLINAWNGYGFSESYVPTIGAGFATKTIMNKYKLQIWDTTGQARYRSLRSVYTRDAKIILWVLSPNGGSESQRRVTQAEAVANIQSQLEELLVRNTIYSLGDNQCPIMLIISKSDLLPEGNDAHRELLTQLESDLARTRAAFTNDDKCRIVGPVVIVSAKTKEGIPELEKRVIEQYELSHAQMAATGNMSSPASADVVAGAESRNTIKPRSCPHFFSADKGARMSQYLTLAASPVIGAAVAGMLFKTVAALCIGAVAGPLLVALLTILIRACASCIDVNSTNDAVDYGLVPQQ
jgi:GTPase SAR1 family protein